MEEVGQWKGEDSTEDLIEVKEEVLTEETEVAWTEEIEETETVTGPHVGYEFISILFFFFRTTNMRLTIV